MKPSDLSLLLVALVFGGIMSVLVASGQLDRVPATVAEGGAK